MAAPIAAQKSRLVKELTELLGLPKNCKGFTLRAHASELVVVDVEYYPDDPPKELVKRKYRLIEVDEPDQEETKD